MSRRINFSQAYKKIGKPQETTNANRSASAANSSLPIRLQNMDRRITFPSLRKWLLTVPENLESLRAVWKQQDILFLKKLKGLMQRI
jgi:hypothetical protein